MALVVLGLVLGVLPSVTVTPAFADLPETCFLDIDGNCTGGETGDPGGDQSAVQFDPPPLLSPRVVADASPAQSAALHHFETRAADLVLAGHHLPDSDRNAVVTWARAETQGMVWNLIMQAIRSDGSTRTTDQQAVVDWIAGRAHGQAVAAAQQAGAEYAEWAGLDVQRYRSLAAAGSEDQLRDFLAQDPVNYGPIGSKECAESVCTTKDQQGGYCNYRSPSPYGDAYTGYTHQTCYVPCTGIICLPPAPSFDQLVAWGTAETTRDAQSQGYEKAYAAIATGVASGSALLASASAGAAWLALTGFLAMNGYWFGNAAASMLFGWAAAGQAILAVSGGIAVALAAVLAGIMVSIQFADQQQLPGKLAALVAGAKSSEVDPAALLETEAGAQTLFALFVSAAVPEPRTDQSCDNSLIPVRAWGGQPEQVTISDPVTGRDRTISTWPCLNTPVEQPADHAPRFYVRADGSSDVLERSSLPMRVPASAGLTTQVRVDGRWFVQDVSDGSSTWRARTLGLTYEDWDGLVRYATTANRQADGSYVFTGLTEKGMADGVDPATCTGDSTCFSSDHLRFVGADGHRYEASLEDERAPLGEPTYSAPKAYHPVTFDAGGFRMVHSNGSMDYRWAFQTPSCGGPCVVGHGDRVTHLWTAAGTYQVELTATDAAGQQVVKDLEVTVASTPPDLTIYPDCATTLGSCSYLSVAAGAPAVLWSQVSHDIASKAETENVRVSWGDGVIDGDIHVHGASGDPRLPVRFGDTSPTTFMVMATHTYRDPGVYDGVVIVRDDLENIEVTKPFTIRVAP